MAEKCDHKKVTMYDEHRYAVCNSCHALLAHDCAKSEAIRKQCLGVAKMLSAFKEKAIDTAIEDLKKIAKVSDPV